MSQSNPFALITAAHLMTQASKHDSQTRYDWKWKLTRMLYERNYTKEQILNLYRFIDWLMGLPESLANKFNTRHKEYEEDKKMPYITTAERIGREEGIKEGIQKGKLEGRVEGRLEGELIGKIQLLQRILKQPVSEKTGLIDKSIDHLQNMFESLERAWMSVQN
ncbi:MAG: hypothetical protein HQK61_08865 [Desulfamplus sp.]|nr:hypothetical protein [Desulfamplus sp.]